VRKERKTKRGKLLEIVRLSFENENTVTREWRPLSVGLCHVKVVDANVK